MTDPLRPDLQPISLMKAEPTTSSSRSNALPSQIQPPLARPSSRLKVQRDSYREDQSEFTSEKVTLALIRRVLCPQTSSHGGSTPQPPEELLPPLTSSNEVDRQLYALIAIIIKEFVYTWYSKLTPDQALVNEVLQVIAHSTRALEQRIRQIDVAQLVLDEIPALVEAHISSYRLAKQHSHLSGLPTSHRALYHELNPHPGLSPVPDEEDPDTILTQSENEGVYRRLLANGILAILLPTEDLENSNLRTLVGDVLADLILGKEVSGKICQGIFFYELIIKITIMSKGRITPKESKSTNGTSGNRLERYGLLSSDDEPTGSKKMASESQAIMWIWQIFQGLYLCYISLRFIISGIFRVASEPRPRLSHGVAVSSPAATPGFPKESLESLSENGASKRQVLDYRVISMASRLFGIPHRIPWGYGLLALAQHLILAGPGRLGDTDGVLDRFLRETIEEYVLPPTLLPNILLATRSALFPANARAVAPGGSTLTPAFIPQPSVQLPNADGKSLTTATTTYAAATSSVHTPQIVSSVSPATHSGELAGKRNDRKGKMPNNSSDGGNDQPSSEITPGSAIATSAPTNTMNASSISPSAPNDQHSPSSTEVATIRRQCAASLLALIPRSVARTLLGLPTPSSSDRTCSSTTERSSPITTTSTRTPLPSPHQEDRKMDPLSGRSSSQRSTDTPLGDGRFKEQRTDTIETPEQDSEEELLLQAIETDLLDLLADEYCNKHLVYAILETVLSKILPELAERSIADLMDDRGVPPVPGF